MEETITLDHSIEMDGHDVAMSLRNVFNKNFKEKWINRFLGDLSDEDYAMVCKFVQENP